MIFVDGEEMKRREDRIGEEKRREEECRNESWTEHVIFGKEKGYYGHFMLIYFEEAGLK